MYSLLGCCAVANSAEAFDVTASGQVSRMAVAPDDAEGDEVQFQDIGFSGSRFRFTGTQPLVISRLVFGMRYSFNQIRLLPQQVADKLTVVMMTLLTTVFRTSGFQEVSVR